MRLFNLAGVPKAVSDTAADSLPVRCMKAEGDDPAELLIYEDIGEDWWGDGVSATDVVDFIRDQKGSPIHVRINSRGGYVYDGMVMYNALASHDATVTVTVEGLAFSMASVIAMAGDPVRLFKASDFGIHRCWGVAIGNQKEMRAAADWMNTIDRHLIEMYQDKTGKPASQIEEWLDGVSDGTVFSAADAVKHGFGDELVDPKASGDDDPSDRTRSAKRKVGRHAGRMSVNAARRRIAAM